MKLASTLFIFLTATLFMSAQEKPEIWTLEACVEYAMENNISVKQAQLDTELSEITKKQAIGNYMPSINGSLSNAWNSGLTQNVTTGVLENQVTRNFSLNASANLTLFKGLQNLKELQLAKMEKLANQYALGQMKDDIALFVANAYLQILVSKQRLAVLKEQNAVTQEQLGQTQKMIDAGTVPKGELLEVKATNADEEQQIQIAKNDLQIAKINLAQTLLIDDYKSFDIADEEYDIPITDILNKSPQEIITKAKEERYEVKLAKQQRDMAEKNVEITKSNYYPTLSAFINYNTRESDRNRVVQSGIDPDNPTSQIGVVEGTNQAVVAPNFAFETLSSRSFVDQLWRNDGLSYGLQLSIPVFNGFQVRHQVAKQKINAERAEFQLEQAELDLESDVYQAFVDAQGALKTYEAATEAVNAQRTAYEYAQERFDVGVSNSFALTESKFRLTNAENNLINAKYDYIFKLKVLELYFGIQIVEY